MQCISPIKLKHGDIVPCGKCNFCLTSIRQDWNFRLHEELRTADTAFFLTLTYEDSQLPLVDQDDGQTVSTLFKPDVQKFLKRLRYHHQEKKTIRYYAVGEYGSKTDRPHYHVIMFNLSIAALLDLDKIWSHGNIKIGDVNAASIPYVTKYHLNKHFAWDKVQGRRQKPFVLYLTDPEVSEKTTLKEILLSIDPETVRCMSYSTRKNKGYHDS